MDINRYSPVYRLENKHLVNLKDYSAEQIFEILYAARSMKAKFVAHENTAILRGQSIAMLFADTSLRTRSAIEIGTNQLGGQTINLPYSKKDMRAGENIKDIVDVISRFGVAALVTRSIPQTELLEFCKFSQIPIINSSNERAVPMQALCDLFTIWEKRGKLEGLKIAYVGKATANLNSLIMSAIKCGMEISVATPDEFHISETALKSALQFGTIDVSSDPVSAVKDADIVYTDSYNYHSSISDKERDLLIPYQVNNTLFSYAKSDALFMHPLPARRGVEVTADIIDGKRSLVLNQGGNKLHIVKSVLALLI